MLTETLRVPNMGAVEDPADVRGRKRPSRDQLGSERANIGTKDARMHRRRAEEAKARSEGDWWWWHGGERSRSERSVARNDLSKQVDLAAPSITHRTLPPTVTRPARHRGIHAPVAGCDGESERCSWRRRNERCVRDVDEEETRSEEAVRGRRSPGEQDRRWPERGDPGTVTAGTHTRHRLRSPSPPLLSTRLSSLSLPLRLSPSALLCYPSLSARDGDARVLEQHRPRRPPRTRPPAAL